MFAVLEGGSRYHGFRFSVPVGYWLLRKFASDAMVGRFKRLRIAYL
jgi:hypothetical protein